MSIGNALLGIFLLWNTKTDLKKREISYPSVLVFVIAGIIFLSRLPEGEILSFVGGMAVGIFIMVVSLLLKESVGFGDGVVVVICGLFLGFYGNLLLLMMGFLLTSITGIALILLKKVGRKSKLPFVPFLTISYGLLILGGVL